MASRVVLPQHVAFHSEYDRIVDDVRDPVIFSQLFSENGEFALSKSMLYRYVPYVLRAVNYISLRDILHWASNACSSDH